jgi:2,3-bisphosphoglycerate-independent phosphoglycerate mutase
MSKPLMLVVLDGFGLAPAGPGNAVALADTPNFDRYWADAPHTQLEASGLAVGLPIGQMGNSEVGHLNLGSGRVVMQSLTYIDSTIADATFYQNSALLDCYRACKGTTLHIMGLVSRGGVHSELSHLFALLELARREKMRDVCVHVFTDGRDTPPDSALDFVGQLQQQLSEGQRIATLSGRYYAMDRDKRWDRVKLAYDAVVDGQADHHADTGLDAVKAGHARGETDEFILPTIVGRSQPIGADDGVVFLNFRADRARQFSHAILDPDWEFFPRKRSLATLHYVSMMEYDERLQRPFAFSLPELKHCLADVIAQAGLSQYHTAETEKYPHVTYFFNATLEAPFAHEERAMVPSAKVATYDLQPEMSAKGLTELTLKRIHDHDDGFILINFANPDMVGHTGVLAAAIKACEASDQGLGKLVEAILAKQGTILILADHGNAEVMIDEHGKPHTSHTTNPVPFIVLGQGKDLKLRSGGKLGDVAPTVLQLMGLKQPEEMTGQSLIER